MFSKADVLVSNFQSHRLKKKSFHSRNAEWGVGRGTWQPAAALLPHGWDLTPTSESQTEASGNRGGGGERRPALPRSFS